MRRRGSATHFVGVHSATHFVYDKAQRVWLMMGEAWEADGPDEGDCVDGYTITWAREFRYDAARARYLNRELDPEALEEGDLVALSEVWTDYDADSSYGDFELDGNPPEPADLRSYEPGVALKDPWDESSGIEYYHADLIGTTRGTTDHLGAPAIGASGSPVTYTAFGERLDSDDHLRYGYAGSWGYQAHDVPNGDPVPYLHVGWRYYDSGTGRFLQRDPIGIGGGWNVYLYVHGASTNHVDPHGLAAQSGGIPTVKPIGPIQPGRIRSYDTEFEPGTVRVIGRRKWYDYPMIFGCSVLGVRYVVDRRPPKPPGATWYWPDCDKWQFDWTSHLHRGTIPIPIGKVK